MTDDTSKNFFDLRTLLAVLLIASTFLGWQFYLQIKYPDAFKRKATAQAVVKKQDSAPTNSGLTVTPAEQVSVKIPIQESQPSIQEEIIRYDSENFMFDISSKGMGLKNVVLKHYVDRKGEPVELGHPEPNALALETRLLGRTDAVDFKIEKINPNMFVGRARIGSLDLTKTLEIDPDNYVLRFKISTAGHDDRFVGVTTFLTEEVQPQAKGNFLMPQFSKQEFFIDSGDAKERVVFGKENVEKTWRAARVAAVGSHYFTQAILDRSDIIPEAKAKLNYESKHADLTLLYPVLNRGADFKIEYLAFVGPKSHHTLMAVDTSLAKVVDFGYFDWIGQRVLSMLRWFYSLVGNWGLAIILLTVIVRLLLLPLNMYSYKSMKAMQVIQPQIQALKERYKDDQQKQQQEMMRLMKENKVNPLVGCLPMFLQLPIFFALYQVLGNSIELYQAPFILWIHDLSLLDPYYILPVLMGLTMFIQNKITPTTMDPAQAKVMMVMPLLFAFLMASLPSGLTLYMWVSAVFGVLQQLYFMRDRRKAAVSGSAK